MTKEQLQDILESVGIKGGWVNQDEYGFSRVFQFEINGQIFKIEWCRNYSTLMVGNVHYCFDNINISSGYLYGGKLIEFTFIGEHVLRLMVKGEG